MLYNVSSLCFDLVTVKLESDYDEDIDATIIPSDCDDEDAVYLPVRKDVVELEKGSVSIPKSEPTPVLKGPVYEEPGELKLEIILPVHT